MKNWLVLLLALFFGVVFLYLSLRGQDWGELLTVLQQINFFWLLPLLMGLVVFVWLTGVRWNILLVPQIKLRWSGSLPALMAGFVGNNILPLRMGEVLRVLLLSRTYKLSLTGVATTVVADRLLDMLAIVWLLLIALPFLPVLPEALILAPKFLLLLAVITVIIMFFLVWRPRLLRAIWKKLSRMMPIKIANKGDKLLEQLLKGMVALRSPRTLIWVCVLSLLKWLASAAMVMCSLMAVGNPISFQHAVLALGAITLLSSAPSLPGFIGVTQLAFVLALGWFGTPKEQALAASVVFWIGQWLPLTIVGGGIVLIDLARQKNNGSSLKHCL